MEGADGFMLVYFHQCSLGIRVGLCLIVVLIWVFPINPHKPLPTTQENNPRSTQKWASFTYVGKETSYITNIFRQTQLKIAFRTTSTLGNLLTRRHQAHDRFFLSGVYKLICPDCNKTYVGQTGRLFSTRYKEHKAAFHNNSNTSSFAKNLIEESHSFDPMNNIMQRVHYHRKGAHLSTTERFHIRRDLAANNHLNDPKTIFPNAIFLNLTKNQQP